MNLYTMVGSGNGTAEATSLSASLSTWHDAMVAHERKIRAGREEACHDECPHAGARALWVEALEIFGDRALDLTFLRSRAIVASEPSEQLVASGDVVSEAADRGRHLNGSGLTAVARRSKLLASSSERSRTATAEV
jgi:hypothetical protein